MCQEEKNIPITIDHRPQDKVNKLVHLLKILQIFLSEKDIIQKIDNLNIPLH